MYVKCLLKKGVKVLVAQLCSTLFDPKDYSLSLLHGQVGSLPLVFTTSPT